MSAFVTNKGGGQKLTVYTLDDCTVDNSTGTLLLPDGIVFSDVKMAAFYVRVDSAVQRWEVMTGDRNYSWYVNSSGNYIETTSYTTYCPNLNGNKVIVYGYGSYHHFIKALILV